MNLNRKMLHLLIIGLYPLVEVVSLLVANFSRDNKFKIELYIDTGNKEDNDFAFSYLKDEKLDIEKNLGYSLEWHSLPEKRACRIWVEKDCSIEDHEAKLDDLIKFGVPELIKFKEVFFPLVKTINFPELEESEE